MPTRRDLLGIAAVAPFAAPAVAADPPRTRFGFSLYGMKTVPLPDALAACAKIGYDAVELALMPGYPTDPAALSADARRDLRKRLADAGLAVPALMENLPTVDAPAAAHAANTARLKAAFDLAHAVGPGAPPLVETILGGKPARWDAAKGELADRLKGWADLAAAAKVVLAVKPHVANALHTPDAAAWLVGQVHSPWLRLAFDQSHFALQGITAADALKPMLPTMAFVHVKDAKGTADKFEFLLPGDGDIDYPALFALLKKGGYAGPVVVEVSGQVFGKPGYDPVAAAKKCYAALHSAMVKAGLRAT